MFGETDAAAEGEVPDLRARPLDRADAGRAAPRVGRGGEGRAVDPRRLAALAVRQKHVAAEVIRAPAPDGRVADDGEVRARLQARDAAHLVAAEDRAQEA